MLLNPLVALVLKPETLRSIFVVFALRSISLRSRLSFAWADLDVMVTALADGSMELWHPSFQVSQFESSEANLMPMTPRAPRSLRNRLARARVVSGILQSAARGCNPCHHHHHPILSLTETAPFTRRLRRWWWWPRIFPIARSALPRLPRRQSTVAMRDGRRTWLRSLESPTVGKHGVIRCLFCSFVSCTLTPSGYWWLR